MAQTDSYSATRHYKNYAPARRAPGWSRFCYALFGVLQRVFSVGVGMAVCMSAMSAAAQSGGRPTGGCVGCHSAGDLNLAMSSSVAELAPGQSATFTLTVAGTGVEAGAFIALPEFGAVQVLAGQGLADVERGLTHSGPRSYSGGQARFAFVWTAPDEPGAVRFAVSAVGSNNNGSSTGDAAAEANFDFVFGCTAQTYYRDLDGDGFGRDSLPLVHCAGTPPPGYTAAGEDCDDNLATTYPGATEYCNLRDDDCDGDIDDDALPVIQYPDADADGYYGFEEYQRGETKEGCEVAGDQWAAAGGDCHPFDENINPGVEEVCNLIDDNCDGDADERVRPQCGEGWCRRDARTCDPDQCEPGEPIAEVCNLFDDDCDGRVDNGAPCPPGEACVTGLCRPSEAGGTGGGGSDGASGTLSGPSGEQDSAGGDGVGGSGGRGCGLGDRGHWAGLFVASMAVVLGGRRRRCPANRGGVRRAVRRGQ